MGLPTRNSVVALGMMESWYHEFHSDMKILIATEDLTDRLLLQLMLRRLGHEPRPVSDGAELLEEVEVRRPDLILLDLQWPILDGCEAVRDLIERNERPKIVGMTTVVRPWERRTQLERWMDELARKPMDETILRSILERLASAGTVTLPAPVDQQDPTPGWIAGMTRRLETLDILQDPREASKLIADYLLASDHHVVALSDPMIAYDQPALASTAHDLAILSGLMGFDDLSAQCRELETTALAGEGPMTGDLREAISRVYHRLRPQLLRYRSSLLARANDGQGVEPQPRNRKGRQ